MFAAYLNLVMCCCEQRAFPDKNILAPGLTGILTFLWTAIEEAPGKSPLELVGIVSCSNSNDFLSQVLLVLEHAIDAMMS